MFSSMYVSVLGAVDTLKGYVASRWLGFRGWFKPRFASCKETVKARTERVRSAPHPVGGAAAGDRLDGPAGPRPAPDQGDPALPAR
jgi:hypothetical protein